MDPVADPTHGTPSEAPIAAADRGDAFARPADVGAVPPRVPDFERDLVCILGLTFDAIDLAQAVERLRSAAFAGRRLFVSTPNLNFAVTAAKDEAFRRSIVGSDLSLVDGMPLVWIARLLGLPIRERVSGADVFEALQRHAGPPLDVFLFGGPPGTAALACQRINERRGGLRCVGYDEAGFGSIESMSGDERIARINASGATFLVVALGARKGQEWIVANLDRLRPPVVSHLGAVVNFAAGSISRAPPWMRRTGLEWVWRIAKEPALARRYLWDGLRAARLVATRVSGDVVQSKLAGATHELARVVAADEAEAGTLALATAGDGGDVAAAGDLRAALAKRAPSALPLRIDLSRARTLSNRTVATLLHAQSWFAERGGFEVTGASPSLRRTIGRKMAGSLLDPAAFAAGVRTSGSSSAGATARDLRILIAAEHASARFGGEAALPLHYFRVLRERGAAVWLVTHARTRAELQQLFPNEERIAYVEDRAWHRFFWQVGRRMPAQIASITVGFLSRLTTQLEQRALIERLVALHAIDVVHQPMPVSPREPSLLFGFGVPVVIGPMNGNMDYPPGFGRQKAFERSVVDFGRLWTNALNRLMPGKRRAAALLVANARTRRALPPGARGRVFELVENGVDVGLWQPRQSVSADDDERPASFIYVGRLVDWKRVDLLLDAFALASRRAAMTLTIVGSGDEDERLQAHAKRLGLGDSPSGSASGGVRFAGWMSQDDCARELDRADVLVLPSVLECGGAVVLEAMAMAKPVIAVAWGGPLDYLDPESGVLVAPESPERLVAGFAEAMVRLACDGAERARLGANGRAKILREYDWSIKVSRILEVYGAAVAAGAAERE